ncbi:MAG TPA: hypothetical protein PLF61_06000, partial [Candidatus Goldiibacteriota bacterium]|nr:hypothetical protein [Candidatus Goldiibacteriota bacterium]
KYVARDLKETFNVSDEKYKIRAAYGLLRIGVIMAKNGNPEEALDYCNFIMSYGIVDSCEIKADAFSKQVTPYFMSTLSYVLPVTAGERKTKNWILLSDFFFKYKDKYKIKMSEKQIFLIRESMALNLLDSAFKDGNVMPIYDIINNYKNTGTFKTAEKIMHIMSDEKDKNKGDETKYTLLNNNAIYDIYKKSVVEIDDIIKKTSMSLIKK